MSIFDDRYLNYGDVYDIIMQSKTVDQAMNVLHLPYVEIPKWVPVTERLPEHHEDVLVTGDEAISGKKVYSVKVWDVDRRRPESAPSIRWDAWMPLPEPYRPEEGQDD